MAMKAMAYFAKMQKDCKILEKGVDYDLEVVNHVGAKAAKARSQAKKHAATIAAQKEQLEKKDKDIAFLKGQITAGKHKIEKAKNIAALKEEKESLQKQLSENHAGHSKAMKAMKAADDATKIEIESLKKTISD